MPALAKAEPRGRWYTGRGGAVLTEDVPPLEPPPCNNCRHRARCAAGPEACVAFGHFLERGRADYWCDAPRLPSAAIFAALQALPRAGGQRIKGQSL